MLYKTLEMSNKFVLTDLKTNIVIKYFFLNIKIDRRSAVLLPCCAYCVVQYIFLEAKIKSSPETALYFYHIYIRRENNGLGNDLRLKMISFRYIPQRISDQTDRKRNRRGSSRGR